MAGLAAACLQAAAALTLRPPVSYGVMEVAALRRQFVSIVSAAKVARRLKQHAGMLPRAQAHARLSAACKQQQQIPRFMRDLWKDSRRMSVLGRDQGSGGGGGGIPGPVPDCVWAQTWKGN